MEALTDSRVIGRLMLSRQFSNLASKEIKWTMHNVQMVQYLLLSTEQAGTYLQSSLVWHHLTYINPSLFDCKQNMENSIFVSFKL